MPRQPEATGGFEEFECDFVHLIGVPKELRLRKFVLLNQTSEGPEALKKLGIEPSDITAIDLPCVGDPTDSRNLEYHLYGCPVQAVTQWTRRSSTLAAREYFTQNLKTTDDVLFASETLVSTCGRILPVARSRHEAVQLLMEVYDAFPDGPVLHAHTCVQLLTIDSLGSGQQVTARSFVETTQIVLAKACLNDLNALIPKDPLPLTQNDTGRNHLQRLLTSGTGSTLVVGVEGCFNNISGWPLHRLSYALSALSLLKVEYEVTTSVDGVWDEIFAFGLSQTDDEQLGMSIRTTIGTRTFKLEEGISATEEYEELAI